MPRTTHLQPRESDFQVHAPNHFAVLLHPWDTLAPTKCASEAMVLCGCLMARTHFCQVFHQDWMHILCPIHSKEATRWQEIKGSGPMSFVLWTAKWVNQPSLIWQQMTRIPWGASPKASQGSDWTPTQSRAGTFQGLRVGRRAQHSRRGCCGWHSLPVPIRLMVGDSNGFPSPSHPLFRWYLITKILRRKRAHRRSCWGCELRAKVRAFFLPPGSLWVWPERTESPGNCLEHVSFCFQIQV